MRNRKAIDVSSPPRGLCGILAALGVLALSSPTNSAAQSAPNAVCPTCVPLAAHAEEASGAPSSRSYTQCGSKATTVTPAIAATSGLDRLRAFLEQPNSVEGSFASGDLAQSARPTDLSATAVELTFELGEIDFHEATINLEECSDSVWGVAHVSVRIGDGVLAFEADGVLWQWANEPAAHFYARADLATATGLYDPRLDTSRIHAAEIEIALYASPGHLRGTITPAAVYFDNEAQLRRHQQGRWLDYAERQTLFRLSFPEDRCADYEVPFARDEPIERLRGRSADALRASVASRIGDPMAVDAVWKNGDETQVTVALGEPVASTVCLGALGFTGDRTAPKAPWALRMPLAGRLRTADDRLDMPLDNLVLSVDDDGVPRAQLGAWVFTEELSDALRQALDPGVDVLEARVTYDFDPDGGARFGGIVREHWNVVDNTFAPRGCLAFPRGGTQDVNDCRYGARP